LKDWSHLQRVVSPLSASQRNFEAREPLHSSRKLCPIETPENQLGLRKNLALTAAVQREQGIEILKTEKFRPQMREIKMSEVTLTEISSEQIKPLDIR